MDIDLALLLPLIAFALWAVVLQICLLIERARSMRSAKRAINTFKATGDTEALDAVSRAHMNTVENLPVFAVVYLCAIWTGSAAPIETLGWVAFGARAVQSCIHMISRSPAAVRVRALMLGVQAVCFVWLAAAAIRTILGV